MSARLPSIKKTTWAVTKCGIFGELKVPRLYGTIVEPRTCMCG